MLTASFRHIRGIGPMRERQLWMQGVGNWDAVPGGMVLAERLDAKLRAGVAESRARLAADDLDFFARALPETEHWRLLPQLVERAGFVDVETAEDVTVIGVLDAEGPRSFVRGRDLHEFPRRAARWRAVVTFNGTAFDLPHLRRLFPGWQPPAAHVDLCVLLRRLGEAGGLKQIEPRLGLQRPPHLAPLTGTDAVWLWRAQREGDRTALRRLLEYNLHDAFHLRPIAEIAYNRMLLRSRMPAPPLPVTERGAMLYDVSKAVERALQWTGGAPAERGDFQPPG